LQLALRADPTHAGAKKQLAKVLATEAKHRDFHTPWRREAKEVFVETNTSEAKLHYYCDSVSAFYKRFSKIFNVRTGPLQRWGKPIGVKIFRTRDGFERYQREQGGGVSESAVGYYSLKNKELVLYEYEDDPNETLDTLFHEGTHLFVHLALGDRFANLPIWLSEGIAEYFGPSRLDRKRRDLDYGHPQYARLRHAQLLIRRPLSLKADLIAHTDYGSFGGARYALAWALVHMLIEKKKEGSESYAYRKRFVSYFDAVSRGADSVPAFEEHFGPFQQMEGEWEAWIKGIELPPFQEAVALVRQKEYAQAIPLLEAHCDSDPSDPMGPYELAEAYVRLGRVADAVPAYERTLAIDPGFNDARLGLVIALVSLGRSKDALPHAEAAVLQSPNGGTYYALAVAAYGAKDKKRANEAIREVVELVGLSPIVAKLKARIGAM